MLPGPLLLEGLEGVDSPLPRGMGAAVHLGEEGEAWMQPPRRG